MAAKWTINVRRTDNGYWCDPEGIVPMQIRSPFSDLKVAELAEEMKRDGRQRDPVTCRKVAGMPHLLDGNRRLAAIKYINSRLLAEGEQPWQVWFVVQEVENELDAILTAATLNATMVMSPLDKAHMYQLALRGGNLTQEQLAARVGKTAAHVSQHLSLLRLGEAEQRAIASGKIGFSAALDLVNLPEASRQQVVEAVTSSEAPMTGSEVKELAATVRRESSGQEGSAPPDGGAKRKMVLSPSKFRSIVTGLGEKNSSFLPLANVFESLWYGEMGEEEFEEEWAEFVAKLHFDYFEKLKADGRIKGVNV